MKPGSQEVRVDEFLRSEPRDERERERENVWRLASSGGKPVELHEMRGPGGSLRDYPLAGTEAQWQ